MAHLIAAQPFLEGFLLASERTSIVLLGTNASRSAARRRVIMAVGRSSPHRVSTYAA
jgi:hypothetical protein